MSKYVTPKIEQLFEAGVHIGHQAKRWHPKMEKYLYTSENKIHIFDLEQSHNLLKNAQEFLYEDAKKGGQVIFVGTKRQASRLIKEAAKKAGALYANERWLGGTITNYKTIKKNMDKLVSNLKKREAGEFMKYTKKERLLIDREIEKLEKYVGGLVGLRGTPSALVVVDPRKEKTSVREALRYKVPVVAIIDSNTDPSNITYPIPGNDDAMKSITMLLNSLSEAVEAGFADFAKLAKEKIEADKIAAAVATSTEQEKAPLIIKTDSVVDDADVTIEEVIKPVAGVTDKAKIGGKVKKGK